MSKRPCAYLAVNLVLFFGLYAPTTIIGIFVEPAHRGFFCNDDTLRYPYQPSSISDAALVILTSLVPSIILAALEKLAFHQWCRRADLRNGERLSVCQRLVSPTSSLFWIFRQQALFFSGYALCLLTTYFTKFFTGRLRPNFFDICQPNWSEINCSVGYVVNYTCQSKNTRRIKEARLSFPSGHVSLFMYSMLFLCIFLKLRSPFRKIFLLQPFIQTFFVCTVIYCSITRLVEHKHHIGDIVAGLILGAFIAMTAMYQWKGDNFEFYVKKSKYVCSDMSI